MKGKYQLPENLDLENNEFQALWKLISDTHQSVFLTGKAGTGKSTFLKYICNNTRKKYVVLAPTGIAAVNVGGMTLHSFFKIPFRPLLPDDPDFSPLKIRKTLRYNKEKVKLLKELDLIIIDEISMVRADIIDFVDKVLRIYCENMREPFGGKQLLFVGDVFQLEPVVTSDMKEVLKHYYKQFFFFNARAFEMVKLVPIELRKIYRQNNPEFISLLDKVRIDKISSRELDVINKRYNPSYTPNREDFVMTLATRRDVVDSINQDCMDSLKTKSYTYSGVIEGEFPMQNLPTAQELTLKVGAQVIFVRNDKDQRWVNGTVGKIVELDNDDVRVELESGESYYIDVEEWENVKYTYEEKKKKIKEELLGTFRQYPIKPAWALTVHKSQGLTFNNIVINFAGGGAFAGGQTYVALSRCTSLEGITLMQPISQRDIMINSEILKFSTNFNNNLLIKGAIEDAAANIKFKEASEQFDKMNFPEAIAKFVEANQTKNVLTNPSIQRLIRLKLQKFASLNKQISLLKETIFEQNVVLRNLAKEYVQLGHDSLLIGADEGKYDSIAVKSAMANFNKALNLYPECVDAMLGKAKVLRSMDEAEEAVALINKALIYDPYNVEGLMEKADYYISKKEYIEAVKPLKKALKTDVENPVIYDNIAFCFESVELDDMADKYKEKAAKLRKKKKK